MDSASLTKYRASVVGSHVLGSFSGTPSTSSPNQQFTDQALLKGAIALAVGCWEGYLEEVLKEFVSKTRVQTHRRAWTLVVQFEALVQKLTADLNTPSWDKSRELIINITGMDPYASWIWSPTYSTQTDTQAFMKGILDVRHSFAHGYATPHRIPGLTTPGMLDLTYLTNAVDFITFLATTTDSLLEHELTHRHACASGWA